MGALPPRRASSRLLAGVVISIAALCLLAWAEPALAQCPMCRKALESPEGRRLAGAFARAILFLLAVPITAVGTIALMVVSKQRQGEGAGVGQASSICLPHDDGRENSSR